MPTAKFIGLDVHKGTDPVGEVRRLPRPGLARSSGGPIGGSGHVAPPTAAAPARARCHRRCGSAGTYNLLQPELAEQLKRRKVANIARIEPQVITTGNVGCMTQIASGTGIPLVHTVELLDWATGGPRPEAIAA